MPDVPLSPPPRKPRGRVALDSAASNGDGSHGPVWFAARDVVLAALDAVAVGLRSYGPPAVGALFGLLLALLARAVLDVPSWTIYLSVSAGLFSAVVVTYVRNRTPTSDPPHG